MYACMHACIRDVVPVIPVEERMHTFIKWLRVYTCIYIYIYIYIYIHVHFKFMYTHTFVFSLSHFRSLASSVFLVEHMRLYIIFDHVFS
jgi:hypothetical protein